MVAIVIIGVGIGYIIDNELNTDKPYATLISSLVFVFIAMYSAVKDLKKLGKDD